MHVEAIEKTISSSRVLREPQFAALVELLRWFANEMDVNPTARAAQGYLSALKDVQRVVGAPVPSDSAKNVLLRRMRENAAA